MDEARSQMCVQTLSGSPSPFRRSIIASTALAFVGFMALSLAAPARADWQSDLRDQLLHEQNCEVLFLSDIEERVVEGQPVVFVRAHCADQRAFDASRTGGAARFKLQACDKNVKAC
jgi:hypothetical protein